MTTCESRVVSITIERDWREVYDFVANPETWPRWAAGLGSGLRRAGDDWVAQGPQGPIRVRFSPPNPFGVLDHMVIPESGPEIAVPLRVIANGSGCDVQFTVFRRPDMDAAALAADAAAVRRDLEALKTLLEA